MTVCPRRRTSSARSKDGHPPVARPQDKARIEAYTRWSKRTRGDARREQIRDPAGPRGRQGHQSDKTPRARRSRLSTNSPQYADRRHRGRARPNGAGRRRCQMIIGNASPIGHFSSARTVKLGMSTRAARRSIPTRRSGSTFGRHGPHQDRQQGSVSSRDTELRST